MPESPLQIAGHLEELRRAPSTLLGRDHELASVCAHIRARRPLFISGPAGVGKTALMQAVYGSCDPAEAVFYCGRSATRRTIATHVLVNLFLNRGRLHSEYVERRTTVTSLAGLRRFVACEGLPTLTRMMHQNLHGERVCMILDHLDDPDPRVAALIEVWLESMPLILVARTAERVGRVRWLLSAFDHLDVPPLTEPTLIRIAQNLLHNLSDQGLRDAELHEAAGRAAGSPGRLRKLLRAAVSPMYRRNGAVQWRLVELDLRIRAMELTMHPRGVRRDRHARTIGNPAQ